MRGAHCEIKLTALPERDAVELAQRLGVHPAQAGEIARESGGHPYWIHELALHARARSLSDETSSSGLTLDEALRARVGRLSAEARALLEIVAVAGKPLDPALAEAALPNITTAIIPPWSAAKMSSPTSRKAARYRRE